MYLNETFTREVYIFTSEATVSITAQARVKAGFDLDRFFSYELKPETREFVVTLPQPEILSAEVLLDIDQIEHGILVRIDETKLNVVLEDARRRALRRAEGSGLLEKAKDSAEVVVRQMFAPLANTPRARYGVRVQFQPAPLELGGIKRPL